MISKEHPLIKFEKIKDKWCLINSNGVKADCGILSFNIDLYAKSGYIKDISKIVWNGFEFCFYLPGSDDQIDIDLFDNDSKMAFESLKFIALSTAFMSDTKIGEEFVEEIFNFDDED